MAVKRIIIYILAHISVLLFVTYFFTGFRISSAQVGYFLLIPVLFGLITQFLDYIVRFFTLRISFWTICLFSAIVFIPILYLIKFFATGIKIEAGSFREINFGIFQVNSFAMSDWVTILITAIIFGLVAASIRWVVESL